MTVSMTDETLVLDTRDDVADTFCYEEEDTHSLYYDFGAGLCKCDRLVLLDVLAGISDGCQDEETARLLACVADRLNP